MRTFKPYEVNGTPDWYLFDLTSGPRESERP
jgi:hypothetical protein